MNLYRMNLDQMTYRDFEVFCLEELPESVILEYKRTPSSTKPRRQIVKAVSALANTQGGLLILGVGTRGNTRHPDWPSDGMLADSDFEKRVTRWCIEHIRPPLVPMIGYVYNPKNPDKAFAVVRVELSRFTPHVVEGGTRVYIRRADNSDPVDATFEEIELLRNQRERALALEQQHISDLRDRLGRPSEQFRSIFLLITPQFSNDDAIRPTHLPRVGQELKRVGFEIGTIRSYSHGVISTDKPGWIFVLTGRGGLGVRFELSRYGEDRDAPIMLESLLGWALLAAKGAQTLSKEAGYWGEYRIVYEAFTWGDLMVQDAEEQYDKCVDSSIAIHMEWSALELRRNALNPAATLFWRMMWAYGQNDRLWTRERIMNRLTEKAKGWGF